MDGSTVPASGGGGGMLKDIHKCVALLCKAGGLDIWSSEPQLCGGVGRGTLKRRPVT